MCLIAFAWQAHPRWRLLLLGNRDEFHERPSAPLAHWDDAPDVIAGRDLQAGGTWMGLSRHGRASVITNVREPKADHGGLSRGLLVSDYLHGDIAAVDHAQALLATAPAYRPFNLLTFDRLGAFYLGNRPGPRLQAVSPGLHGLSNADFNAPWPKTQALTRKLRVWIDDGGHDDFPSLFAMLSDRGQWPDDVLPDTGVGVDLERVLSSAFIVGERYGTRASTIIAIGYDNAAIMIERRFGANGVPLGETTIELGAAL
jgi:uncharacterized protein with NRDE domain